MAEHVEQVGNVLCNKQFFDFCGLLRELHLCLRSVPEALAVSDLEVGACTGSALQDRPMHDLLILLWLWLQ